MALPFGGSLPDLGACFSQPIPDDQRHEPRPTSSSRFSSALLQAAHFGDSRAIHSLLLRASCDVNAGNEQGDTALHHACAMQRTDAVAVLLAKGANPRQANADLETPLHFAALSGDEASVRLLLAHGASSLQLAAGGVSALHNAVWKRHRAVSELLLSAGADPNAATADGHTPLHFACVPSSRSDTACSFGLLKLLLQFGADVQARDCTGSLPIHFYVRCAPPRELEVLLRACGASETRAGGVQRALQTNDGAGNSLLHLACRFANVAAVDLLLKWPKNAWPRLSVDSCNASGSTALHEAAASGKVETVQMLKQQSPRSIFMRDGLGRLPIDVAANADVAAVLSRI